ncbi:MAG: sulfatase-like hydrolase/transferase [bacterium]|nr:sulfatase-like hydrolase/transferase [bacterium]
MRLLGALLATAPCLAQGGWNRPLNVLVVITDQHNARMLGHASNGFGGAAMSMTPNLDTLASQGARFEAAFCVTPQCSPSRFTILTGRWPHEHGLRSNRIWEPQGNITFPRLAADAGYVTATIGKHHFHWLSQPTPLAEDHGFDVIVDERDYTAFCASMGTAVYNAQGRVWGMPNLFNARAGGHHLPLAGFTFNTNELHPAGYWADRAIDFIEDRAGPGGDHQPFVLYYSMVGPHTPILPTGPAAPQDWAHAFHPFDQLALASNLQKVSTTTRLSFFQEVYEELRTDQHQEMLSYYYGLVHQIDWNIGRVLARLEALGIADETIVVFTADHGEMASEMGCWTKGAGSYDALTRVPLIVRLPGAVTAGSASDALVSNVDLMPTLLELTGIPIADDDRTALSGASLTPMLTGAGTPPAWRDTVFVEQGDPQDAMFLRLRSARTATAKYTFDELGGGEEEYYELSADPWELDNVIGQPQHQAAIAALRGTLDAWWNGEQGHAPYYTASGGADAAPAQAASPFPADGALGVARDVDPTFVPSTAADTMVVRMGRAPHQLELFAELSAMSDRFNVGTLEPGRDYYWRVEGTNANGVSVGPVWHFRTENSGSGGPALATDPSPTDRETAVELTPVLVWTPDPGTVSQRVHFGRRGELQPASLDLTATETTFAPGALEAGVAYEWRIDTQDANGATEGTVWSFTTDAAGLPQRSLPARPRHLGRIPLTMPVLLEFAPAPGATSYDIYFGSELPLNYRGTQSATTFGVNGLVAGGTYSWRVDTVNASGARTGFTWRFTVE